MQDLSAPAVAKWAAALVVAQWVGMPAAVHCLLGAMALDYVSGLIAGGIQGKLASSIAFRGLLKKLLVLIVLLAVKVAETAAGMHMRLVEGAALAYVGTELISIAENCTRAGLSMPPQVLKILLQAQKLRGDSAKAAGAGQ